jgi:hypothetical protein
MAKAMGSWSGMRKYLENEMLAKTLRGRVRYSCTTFSGMDGCGIFEVFVDEKSIKRFSMETVASAIYPNNKKVDMIEYWNKYWSVKESAQLEQRKEFDDIEFADALTQYRLLDISQAIASRNPIVRMFAILDRRVGKRTLEKLAEIVDSQPVWLQYFYRLRMSAENISCML